MNLDDLRGRAIATVQETAEVLGCDDRTVRRGIERGELPGIKIGTRLMVPVPRLLALIEPGGAPQPQSAMSAPAVDSEAVAAALEVIRGALAVLDLFTRQADDGGAVVEPRRLREAG